MKDYITPAPYVIFKEDGTIVSAGRQGISFITDRIADGERILLADAPLIAGEVGATRFVDVAARAIRTKTPCPASLDGMTLRGLPLPCRIEISKPFGEPTVYAETEAVDLDLTFDFPGTYAVRVLSVPHLPGSFTVVVP